MIKCNIKGDVEKMCGIFGCIGKMSEKNARKCINEISYRGPDTQIVKAFGGAVLAHARLSIIDISEQANQPMADLTGRYWIVYNGEIYNYIEIRKDLEQKGYRFKTQSDTEVILYAYIEWGEFFQNKCNGMWALAIWDDQEKSLFLSRDRFGVKPLYIYQQESNFYFASEMKAFFPIMRKREINYSIFERKDYFGYESTEKCCIKDIGKIGAGFCGYYVNNKLVLKRWWLTLEHLVDVPIVYQEQVELFRALFLDACRLRMRSDVPIGTALSGGVDSSAVVGAMHYISLQNDRYISDDWQHTFVASMPGTVLDETFYAEKASQYIGVDIKEVDVTANIAPEKIMRYMYVCEDPYVTSPIPFMQTYKSISETGIRVTLDGHGADELFGGYKEDIFFSVKDCEEDQYKIRQIWQTYNSMQFPEDVISLDQFMKLAKERKIGNSIDGQEMLWNVMGNFNNRLYLQTHNRMLPTLLRCYDRYSMGNSVEIRMPFLDYRIVCFAFSIPYSSKIKNGFTKSIIRDACAPFMDHEVMYRKAKIGFNSPMTEWFQGDLKEFLLDTIHSKDFMECELINPEDVRKKVNKFFCDNHGYYKEGASIWNEIMPYLWKKAVIDNCNAGWSEEINDK